MCETNRRREIIAKIRSGEISCPDTCPIADKCELPKHDCWGSVTRQLMCAERIMKAEVK